MRLAQGEVWAFWQIALADLQTREERGDFRTDPVAHCLAGAAVSQPPTFGDSAAVRLAPCASIPPSGRSGSAAIFGALLQSTEGFDWTDSLDRAARIPRLVIHGAWDNTPLAGNREWVAGQPNPRILVVEGAGH